MTVFCCALVHESAKAAATTATAATVAGDEPAAGAQIGTKLQRTEADDLPGATADALSSSAAESDDAGTAVSAGT